MQLNGTPGRIRLNISYTNFTCLQLEKNINVFDVKCVLMNDQSTSIFFSNAHVVTICCNFGGVECTLSACTDKYSGSFNPNRAKSFTLFVCVALNNKVWRSLGRFCRIAFKVFEKPKSNMRSASSSTNTCNETQSNIGVSSMCCNNRPGVQTNIFILSTRSASAFTSLPPMSKPADIECRAPTLVKH